MENLSLPCYLKTHTTCLPMHIHNVAEHYFARAETEIDAAET